MFGGSTQPAHWQRDNTSHRNHNILSSRQGDQQAQQKSGGAYVSYTGQVRRSDMTLGTMTFQGKNGNHKTIAIADISDVHGDFAERRTS